MKKGIRRLKKSFLALGYLLLLILGTIVGTIVKCVNKKYKDVWLISERGVDARDNGFVFFEYLCKNHPEVNCYYIIDKHSTDYEKVKNLGKTVGYKSFMHYMLLGISKYNISTHVMGYTPDMVIFVWLDRLHIIRGKKIFLQHGIIKDDMLFNHYPHIRVDIFNTTAKPEYEYIRDTYGHPEGVVQMLGMCRYDKLCNHKNQNNRQILLMPTWRNDVILNCKTNKDFKKTEYFKVYQSLLNSTRLNDILEKYDATLIFYPHLEMQKYLSTYSTKYERMKIASFQEYDVQKLLVDSQLLITDYSSVYFDFAYMEKPEIYYQFDEQAYRKGHYKEGYFSYRKDGFGPVVTKESELLQQIIECANSNWSISDIYMERIKNFFSLRDRNNCERTYEAIIKL